MNYDTPPTEVLNLIEKVMEDYHPDLAANDVKVDAIFAITDEKPLKSGGYPAMAFIKINSLKLRIKGMKDAEITLDKSVWDNLNDQARVALIDHELTHLQIATDKEGNVKYDDANRPKLKMRRHDYQMGWFREVALRHGEYSPERVQAQILMKEDGDTFFGQKI